VFAVDSKRIDNPSAFILLGEDLYMSPTQEIDPTNEISDRSGLTAGSTCYPPPHAGYGNFLFADGHVTAFQRWEDRQMTYWYTKLANWQSTPP
jgi:prepilin-type processing-associated H-X9-DG protein